jgi:hypothetical protein
MAFKYYLRGPDNWTELSGRMQHWLARRDDNALSLGSGPMTGIAFQIPNVRHGLGRPAKYEIRCTWDNTVHTRFMCFEDGTRAHVQYVETAPDVLDTDWYYPAPLAI